MTRITRTARILNRRFPYLPALLVMSDAQRMPDPTGLIPTLPRGSAFIFRHYGAPNRPNDLELGRTLAALCRAHNILFLVAGDPKLARTLRADGLHLPQYLVPRARLHGLPPHGLITAAAHDLPALRRAKAAGVDACLLSPVFPTKSHEGEKGLGVLRFANLVRQTDLPVYALGGVTNKNAARLASTGAAGLAGISFVLNNHPA